MPGPSGAPRSVCVYCASSPLAGAGHTAEAARLGAILAGEGVRLVYGGGSLGLMGACAGAALAAGGEVLGVIPGFLTQSEPPMLGIDLRVVESMHQRKLAMFEAADAFAILPGAIGTLEEAVEVISWRRLGLHDKPIVFLDAGGYWRGLLDLFERFLADGLAPAEFARCWRVAERVEDLLPLIRAEGGDREAGDVARLT